MDYKVSFFRNPQNQNVPGKYYPYPVYEKTIGLDDFVKEISHATSLTSTDVRAVIMEVIEIFHRYLVRGHKVKLDGIGTFKISFKGIGEATAEAVSASSINKSTVRITFVADSTLKQEMRTEISFSKVTGKNSEPKDTETVTAIS